MILQNHLRMVSAVALTGLVGLAACGHQTGGSSLGSGGISASRSPAAIRSVSLPTSSLPPLRELGTIEASHLARLPWKLISTQHDGLELAIFVTTGCSALTGVTIRQTSETVTVTVFGSRVEPSQPCAGTGGGRLAAVRLSTPLGPRSLVHG